jgi:site-specific recombinase XerD
MASPTTSAISRVGSPGRLRRPSCPAARQSGSDGAHELRHIGKLWEHLSRQGKTWSTMVLTDIDAFLVACAQRYARSTTAGIAGSVRSFTHFLLATGHISIDLADSVIAPVQPKHGVLTIRHSKDRSRIVPIRADLVAELQRYSVERDRIVRPVR